MLSHVTLHAVTLSATHVSAVDSLLAAQARNRDLVLVSANTRDFKRTGVELLNPFEGHGDGDG